MSPCRKFSKLLTIELESLEDELEYLVDVLDERLAAHEITNYVRNENYTVLRNELLGLRDFMHTQVCQESSDLVTVQDVANRAKERVQQRIEEHGYMPALQPLIERRIDKITAYLELDTAAP